MQTKDLMTSTVVTVSREHSIWHAAQIMLDCAVSGLPVVDDGGYLIGIVTEGDLLHRIECGDEGQMWAARTPAMLEQRIGAYIKSHSWRVGDAMTTQVISIGEDSSLSRASALMIRNRIKRLPVVRDGRLVGILSRKDLLRVVAAVRPDKIASGDDAMRLSILTRLREHKYLQSAHLTVAVLDNGDVHLGGMVRSDTERTLARVVAESVQGVTSVQDDIQVVVDLACDSEG